MLQQKTKFKSRIFPAFSFKAGNRAVFDQITSEEFVGKIWLLPPLFRKFQQRIAFSRFSRVFLTQRSLEKAGFFWHNSKLAAIVQKIPTKDSIF